MMATFEQPMSDDIATHRRVITPPSGWRLINLHELWLYRDLLWHLVWRDIKIRYKQTVFGIFWAVLQPFITMIAFTVVFDNIAEMPSDGIPYPVFSAAALVPWTFFSTGIQNVSQSITSNVGMLKKVYMPRIIMPLSSLFSSLFDLLAPLVLLLLMVLGYQIFFSSEDLAIGLSWRLLAIVPLIGLAFITALGFGLWLASFNVQFRDVRYATGFIVRLWMYITPVIYPASLIKEKVSLLYYLNPMATVIDGFRWATLGVGSAPPYTDFMIAATVAIIVLLGGIVYFNRTEKWFADIA